MPNKAFSVFLGILGVLMFSSKAVMVKLAYQFEVDTITLLLLRMLFSLPFYLAVIAWHRLKTNRSTESKKAALTGKDFGYLILFGFLGYYLASYFDFLGLNYIKAGLERIILFLYPTLVLLISWIALGQKITRQQLLGVIITYLGVVGIFAAELNLSVQENVWVGGILIFLSALTYGSYIVGSGWLIPKFGATLFTSYAMVVSCICVILHYLITTDTPLFELASEVYVIGLLMAVFATVIPSYLISYSIKGLGASNFSILGSLGPVSTIVLAWIFLDETMTWFQLVGAIVVITGIYVAERKR
ncbi:MAG: DMT family transporter [Cyclobacteriaceae bacterium]